MSRHAPPGKQMLVNGIAMAVALLCATRALHAQSRLDTGGVMMKTRAVNRIAPTASDNWEFSMVRDVIADNRGQVYVLEDIDQKIRVFGADGKLVRTMGRQGSGPGEFTHAYSLQILGDTLWVNDTKSLRITPFSTVTGKLIQSGRKPNTDWYFIALSPVGAYSLVADISGRPRLGKPLPMKLTHQRVNSNTSELLTRFKMRPSLSYRVAEGKPPDNKSRGSVMQVDQPFDDSWLYHVGAAGRVMISVDRDDKASASRGNIFGGSSARTSIRIMELGYKGDTTSNRRYDMPAMSITADQLKVVIDSLAHPNVLFFGKKPIGNPSEIGDSLYTSKTWPPITGFYAGDDGSIWLRQPSPPSRIAKFWRIDADGTVLPSVSVSSDLRIYRVSANRIWGTRENADGVPVVEVHEVVK